jgi:hypothetical protein
LLRSQKKINKIKKKKIKKSPFLKLKKLRSGAKWPVHFFSYAPYGRQGPPYGGHFLLLTF